jgi:hypothetical protein
MVTIESTQSPRHGNSPINALPKNATSRPWGTHKGCPNVAIFLLQQRASSHQPGMSDIKNHDDHHHGGHYWPHLPNYWELDIPLQPQLRQYQNTTSVTPPLPHHHQFLSNSCCRHTTWNKNISTNFLCSIKSGSHPLEIYTSSPHASTPKYSQGRSLDFRLHQESIFCC